MKPRAFTTVGERSHKLWLERVFGIEYTRGPGIDFFDDRIAVELKCRDKTWAHNWAVHHYQIKDFEERYKGIELFWAFLLYQLNERPVSIRGNRKSVEPFVDHRELYLFNWDWIKQFPVSYPKTGPYVYVHKSDFPDESNFARVESEGSVIFLPKNTLLEERVLSVVN